MIDKVGKNKYSMNKVTPYSLLWTSHDKQERPHIQHTDYSPCLDLLVILDEP